jgi:glucose/mannose transport system permease protein
LNVSPLRRRARIREWTPILVVAPSLMATFVCAFVFTGWTHCISMSNSTLLPTYGFVGLKPYFVLWSDQRRAIA